MSGVSSRTVDLGQMEADFQLLAGKSMNSSNALKEQPA
jgi:hypothetical protein